MPYKDMNKQRQYQNERNKRARLDWLEAHGPCVVCGSGNHLEVDHIDPALKVSHRIWSWSLSRRLEELDKCQVLCKSCHVKKTAEWNSRPIPHGTDSAYTKRMCRCGECTEAHRKVKKAWRAQRRAAGLSVS